MARGSYARRGGKAKERDERQRNGRKKPSLMPAMEGNYPATIERGAGQSLRAMNEKLDAWLERRTEQTRQRKKWWEQV